MPTAQQALPRSGAHAALDTAGLTPAEITELNRQFPVGSDGAILDPLAPIQVNLANGSEVVGTTEPPVHEVSNEEQEVRCFDLDGIQFCTVVRLRVSQTDRQTDIHT